MDNFTVTRSAQETAETYRRLLEVEIKALLSRVNELTGTVADVFLETNAIALQLERAVGGLEQISGRQDFLSTEVTNIKSTLTLYEGIVGDFRKRIFGIEDRLKKTKFTENGEQP